MGNHWIVIPIVGIVAGCYFVVEEVLQLVLFGPSRYFRSLYNYVEVTSIVLTIICLSQSIHMSWRQEPSAYRQFEVTPFAIVAMYLHLCNDGGVCTQSPTKHPYNVLSSFTTTLFFLAGRYDVVADDFERHDTSFLLIMTIFYFVVILTMMNVFIAMMIDAFNSTYSHAEQARRVQLSEALSAVETVGRAANVQSTSTLFNGMTLEKKIWDSAIYWYGTTVMAPFRDKDIAVWHYLKSDCQFEVRPHHEIARINVSIELDQNHPSDRLGNLWVRSLKLVPPELVPSHPEFDAVNNGALQPNITIVTQSSKSNGSNNQASSVPIKGGVVTRLATSKDHEYHAALSVFSDHVTVQVWHKDCIAKPPTTHAAKIRDVSKLGALAKIKFPDEDPHSTPLELVLSDNGEYVAVYQAPKIGDWLLDSSLPESSIGVKLYRNPIKNPSQTIPIPMNNNGAQNGNLRDAHPRELIETTVPKSLQHAVGYATFVSESKSYWRSLPDRFVFCDGLYLDVFIFQSEGLTLSHSIPLVDFPSNMWRTVACELAVRSIVSNMFIWVTDNGRHCSTWDLGNGSNIGRIEIGGLQHNKDTVTPAIKVACNENIIAIVGFDNSITTVDASSGIVISRRIFDIQAPIENIAFPSSQSETLLVFQNRTGGKEQKYRKDHEQTISLVDPLCLNTQVNVPHPSLFCRSSVFGYLGLRPWHGVGVLCEPDADQIQVSLCDSRRPLAGGTQGQKSNRPLNTCLYELKITTPRSHLGSQETYARQVEIWKREDPADLSSSPSCVFSFIPEPWELHRPAGGQILRTGDRFVVHAGRTIQLWSLPTPNEPRCKLIFFWSSITKERSTDISGKTETDIVMDYHRRFNAAQIHDAPSTDENAQLFASAVYTENVRKIAIPSSPLRLTDTLKIRKHCVQNIRLLALTHTLVSSRNQDLDPAEQQNNNDGHARAILDFVGDHINHSVEFIKHHTCIDHINHSVPPKHRSNTELINHSPASGKCRISVLTNLLEPWYPPDFSTKFIASLLQSGRCTWVPRSDNTTNPIEAAIKHKNAAALKSLLDYCTSMAHRRHPLYLAPIEQCFKELVSKYPEHLQATLRNTSYIPARGVEIYNQYVTLSTYAWRPIWLKLVGIFDPTSRVSLGDYPEPTISFQIQSNISTRTAVRPTTFSISRPVALEKPDDWKVYVAPFPSLVTLDSFSQFIKLAGKDGFDNAALMSLLRFKLWQHGLYYWCSRLLMLLAFYGIFLAMVVTHVARSTAPESIGDPSTLYLNHFWKAMIGIVFAAELCLTPSNSCGSNRSPYNYIDLISIGITTTCFAVTLISHWTNDSPRQFPLTSFAILGTYLHLIAETRIFKRVGTIVNTLLLIIKRIWDFFLLFSVVVIGFTHTLVFYFHAFQTPPKKDDACGKQEGEQGTKYPHGAMSAFTTTLFFLAGRYDAIGNDFEAADYQFLVLIMGFYFFVVLFLLNVLIALMSDALNRSRKEGEQAWRKQLAEALAEGELTLKMFETLAKYLPFVRSLLNLMQEHPFFQRRNRPTPTYLFYLARVQNTESDQKSPLPENQPK
ncbi:hypothetical protein BGZ73_004579 [Actinomortierella ambigua]|nr:hypothetical protein BGZ73_004579 [Actinomortierella ambigua]